VHDGKIQPLMARDDFAPDYRDVPFEEALQSMIAVLQESAAKGWEPANLPKPKA
jgi:hypothetical protein